MLRPTEVLFESDDIALSGKGTNADDGSFYVVGDFDPKTGPIDIYPEGNYHFLIASDAPGNRAEHFASPVAPVNHAEPDVWIRSLEVDLALWLGFGNDDASTFSEPPITFSGRSPVPVTVDFGGLALNPGQTYAVVFDFAVLVPEPNTLLMVLMGASSLCFYRRRRSSASEVYCQFAPRASREGNDGPSD